MTTTYKDLSRERLEEKVAQLRKAARNPFGSEAMRRRAQQDLHRAENELARR